ncbi:hypothetical protein HanPSC8_Chr14g0614441 [Helianthus annuus]|nr:hypothetical protein HanPSC8_Chr14g0614441 [Helianthus annuus]
MRNIKDHTMFPANLPQKRVNIIDTQLLIERRIPSRSHYRVPHYMHHPRISTRCQELHFINLSLTTYLPR